MPKETAVVKVGNDHIAIRVDLPSIAIEDAVAVFKQIKELVKSIKGGTVEFIVYPPLVTG